MMANEVVASVIHISWVNKKPAAGQMDKGVAIAPSTSNFFGFFFTRPSFVLQSVAC
jgi:hypothetical protein